MEPDTVHSIANLIFDAMPATDFNDLSANDIELFVQQMVSQIANSLMQDFIFPSRIAQIQHLVASGQILCQSCSSNLQLHKRDCSIHPKTIFASKITLSRNQYYCPKCDSYLMVADQQLELLSRQMTPRLALIVVMCGASWPYVIASAFLHFLFGVEVSAKTIELTTTDERLLPAPLEADPMDHPPGVVTMDGVVIHGRKADEWLEMKVGSFFSTVVEVSKDRREVMDASFAANSCEQWKDFQAPVTAEALRRGIGPTSEVEFVADSAEGIWSLCDMVFPLARKRLDLYHAKCKIGERSREAFSKRRDKKERQEKLQGWLEKGEIGQALKYLQKHMPKSEGKKEAARKLIRYLKRNEERIANYEQVKEAGGTRSSGLTEKGNDLVVNRRMKEGIMHWSRKGANPILLQRTGFINKYARARTGPYELAFCQA
jgi:hypothetical protein